MAQDARRTNILQEPATESSEHIKATFPINLRWGDLDIYGHVNNVQYFRIFEEARAQWMSQRQAPSFLDRGIVIASQSMDYLAPMKYAANSALVDLSVEAPSRSSVTLHASISIADANGQVTRHATAKAVIVAFDALNDTSRPWQNDERKWLLRQVP